MPQTALITGASAGLGTEYARLFAEDKHDVVLVARRRDRLEALGAELERLHGIRAHVIDADLGTPEGARRVIDEVLRMGIAVDFLVNNAGFGSNGPFAELDAARETEMVQVNVTTLVALTRAFLPGMVERKRGRVLNIGSTAGFQPGPYMATYCATKAFVNSFTEAIAEELRGTGVTATVSCPGATATEFAGIAGNDKSFLFKQGVMTAKEVAEKGYRAMMAGRPMAVHGLMNQLAVQMVRLTPRAVLRPVVARILAAPSGPPKLSS